MVSNRPYLAFPRQIILLDATLVEGDEEMCAAVSVLYG